MPYSMKFAQKKTKIKIKFQKIKNTFLDSTPWLKSHQSTLLSIDFYGIYHKKTFCKTSVLTQIFLCKSFFKNFEKLKLY